MSVIETTGLTKHYGDTRANQDLDFEVEEGEVFGYLGPNGAGKTTTIRTLLGLISPTDGTATVLGHDIQDEDELIEAKANVGYLPSDLGFDEKTTGEQFLAYQASLKGDERSEELLETFDAPVERPIGQYSMGNKQKLAIVQAFMHDPDLIIMDEPTAGLDPLMQQEFYEFVREEKARGKTVFFSSHILSEVRKICDRVGIIRNGEFVTVERVDELLERNGKHIRVHVDGSVDEADFDVDGVFELSVDESTAAFMFTGEYNDLLAHLADYDVVDLEIEEAPLEDVFMKFYGETDV